MARISPLFDGWGVIHDAAKRLPTVDLKLGFLEALAELEDHECHRTRKFPKTRLHRVVGYKEPVYRADIDKISGWRLHLQYEGLGQIHLKDIIDGQRHDDVLREIEAKKIRYAKNLEQK
ncbi:MAG TPA: hypothetical protein VGV35_13670 [Bryobacteraceae bacterium]|nr:hypothetical protein [Bryobacteraceae bacterium]